MGGNTHNLPAQDDETGANKKNGTTGDGPERGSTSLNLPHVRTQLSAWGWQSGIGARLNGACVTIPCAAALGNAAVTSVINNVVLLRKRVLRRLHALSSLRRHRPAQDRKLAGLGKRVMSTPISATGTRGSALA